MEHILLTYDPMKIHYEAFLHALATLRAVDISQLPEPNENAAIRVSQAWQDVGIPFSGAPVAVVANAIDIVIEYARAIGAISLRDPDMGSDGGSAPQNGPVSRKANRIPTKKDKK